MARALAVAVLCAALACASAMDTAPYTSAQWQSAGRAPRDDTHCVHLALQHTPEALAALDSEFWAVSNPQHSKYGQYHTPQSLAALMAMPQSRVDAVRQWIASRVDTRLDVPRVTLAEPSRDRVRACMSVAQAEHVFGTELHVFVNAKGHSARRVVRAATRIDMPQHIADHIAYASGLNAPIVTHEARAAKRVAPVVDPNTQHVVGVQPATAANSAPGAVLGDASTAPILTLAYGGNELMTIGFMIRCANGTTNIDSDPTKAPCTSRGPAVESFTVSVTPVTNGYQPFTRTIALAQVTRGWDGSGAYGHRNNATYAYVNVEVRKYVGYNVQIQTNFVGGVVSPWSGMNDVPVYCTDYVTPTFLKQLYGIPSGLQVKNAASTISVAEFGQQYYSDADLAAYLSAMGMPAPRPVTVIGPNNQSLVGGEAQLDIQVVMAIAVAAPTTFWSVDSSPTANEPFDTWLTALANDPNVPLVHSVSYADAEETLQRAYMDSLNAAFQQAGVRGLSLLFASGDDGVASYLGRGDDVPHWCQAAHPEFPSCSPMVTSVGGTQLSMNSAPACTGTNVRGVTVGCTGAVETVCSASLGGVITSGGGFSNTYGAPDYQQTVVQAYLNNPRVSKPPANFFNSVGRGYPDVAGMAAAYLVMMNGELVPESGTSASTPLWASMVALWNDIRLSSGQPPLGFLNPWLYQLAASHPEVFNDVVTGDNRCLVNGYECCANGFNAAPGWDPTTGLGSPKFIEIANLVLNPNAQYSFVNTAGVSAAEAEKEKKTALVIAIIALILSTVALFGLCVVRRGIQKDTALLGNTH